MAAELCVAAFAARPMGTTGGCVYIPSFCSDAGIDADALWKACLDADYIPRDDPAAKYRGKALPRSKLYINITPDDFICIYKFPGFQWVATRHYKELAEVPWFKDVFSLVSKQPFHGAGLNDGKATFNQAIVTLYNCGTDNIGWHSDKPASIAAPSVIMDISLGSERTFCIRNIETGEEESVRMQHGSAICFTTAFNAKYQHAVLAEPGAAPRASIVFRHIADVYTKEQVAKKVCDLQRAKARKVMTAV